MLRAPPSGAVRMGLRALETVVATSSGTCQNGARRALHGKPSLSRGQLVASPHTASTQYPQLPYLLSSVRGLSTEPVLKNSGSPPVPPSPIAKPALDPAPGEPAVACSEKVERLSTEILALNMVELGDLLKILKTKLGLTDADLRGAAMGPVGGAGAGGAEAAPAEEEKPKEKENFDLKLVSFDDKSKIKVIKEVRTITGLGLKEAKELVEGVPKVIKKDVKKDEAEKLVAKLKEVGAVVELA